MKIYSNSVPELIEEDIFKIIIPIPQQATQQATQQAKILEFCKTPKTREEIQHFLNLKDREYFRSEILKPLINKELLLLTIPNKPTSPKQKYYSKEN